MSDKIVTLQDENQNNLYPTTSYNAVKDANGVVLPSDFTTLGQGGSATTVKVDGTSITSNNEADLKTINGNYNASTNKLATASDIPSTSSLVSDVSYDSTNKKLKQTKGSSTTDVVTFGNNAFTSTTIPTSDSGLTNDRYVRYDTSSQGLTSTQQSNVRTNIGAQKNLPTTSTAGQVLKSTSTAGTVEWGTISGSSTDVQVNGTSIVSNNVANLLTNTAYNASTNKLATMSDIPTETDPVFSASASAGITSSDITNWNNAKINSIGTNYIRYENGIQICWGTQFPSSVSTSRQAVAFAQPFIDTNYALLTTAIYNGSPYTQYMLEYTSNNTQANQRTTSGTSFNGTLSRSWMAIGKWK